MLTLVQSLYKVLKIVIPKFNSSTSSVIVRLNRSTCTLSIAVVYIHILIFFYTYIITIGDVINTRTPRRAFPQRSPKSHLFKTPLDSQTESDSSVFEIPSTPMPGSHDQFPPTIPSETNSAPLRDLVVGVAKLDSKAEPRRSKTRNLKLKKNTREVLKETDKTGELTFGTPQHSQPAYQEGQRSYVESSLQVPVSDNPQTVDVVLFSCCVYILLCWS